MEDSKVDERKDDRIYKENSISKTVDRLSGKFIEIHALSVIGRGTEEKTLMLKLTLQETKLQIVQTKWYRQTTFFNLIGKVWSKRYQNKRRLSVGYYRQDFRH